MQRPISQARKRLREYMQLQAPLRLPGENFWLPWYVELRWIILSRIKMLPYIAAKYAPGALRYYMTMDALAKASTDRFSEREVGTITAMEVLQYLDDTNPIRSTRRYKRANNTQKGLASKLLAAIQRPFS